MLIDSARKVPLMVETLVDYGRGRLVSIFIDFEGEDLGAREGTADILTIFHLPTNFSFLVPLADLRGTIFDITHSLSPWTVRDVLEDHNILKGIWDVRNDSAGLLRDHGIYLGGMFDVQIALCKVDSKNPRHLGLAAAIEAYCEMTETQIACFRATKIRGKAMWCPEEGGSFEVFRAQPLEYTIKAYSFGNVALLVELLEELTKYLTSEELKRIRGKSTYACEKSWSDMYNSGFDYSKARSHSYVKGSQREERLWKEREALKASGKIEIEDACVGGW